ncbi:MAG: 1-hydroxycarotenoid 3,4-desaturase CrtD [Bacteroidota bacterium]
MKVGIIGAGIAGIASAVRMASRGYEVEVFEANNYPGGKLSQFQIGAYRFDAGPSLFTMPSYVEDLFRVAQRDIKDYFSYERLAVVCEYFWEDQTRLTAFAEQNQFAAEVEEKLDIPADKVLNLLSDSAHKYEVTGKIFLEKSLHRLDTWLNLSTVKAMLKIPTLDLFSTMNRVNEKQLQHPKLVQLFNRYATYNGSNPYKTPGLLNIIPHFEYGFGAFFPKGGMFAITNSLFQLAKDLGVRFHFGQKVEEIIVEHKTAKALQVAGEKKTFDRIISNMDVFHAYRKLLPDEQHPHRILRQPKSSSALIFYWGVERSFPELDVHNILFSEDYETEFTKMEAGDIHDDPTVYINITSKKNPADAPENCENWFTMINVPCNSGQDWGQLVKTAKKNILAKIKRTLGVELSPLIACEDLLDPRSIESRTQSHLGALYGTSSNNKMAAFLRHANFSKRIKNLYFCGGSVHPGGGIPLCLLSAKIVDEVMV